MRLTRRALCKLILLIEFISICLLVHISSGIGYTQENKPITKKRLIAALEDCKTRRSCRRCQRCKLKVSDFIEQIKKYKVNFLLTKKTELSIRRAGSFLSENEVNELINVVHLSPFFMRGLPFDDLVSFPRDNNNDYGWLPYYMISDSSGDTNIDGKIRLIVTSINISLRLDTSHKFLKEDDDSDIYSEPNAYDKDHPDGTILIGILFIKETLPKGADSSSLANDSLLYFRVGHAASHLKQKKVGWAFKEYKKRELHADFLAGWCLARFLRSTKKDSPEYQDAFFQVINPSC